MAIFYTDLLMKSLDKDSLMLLSSQPDTEPECDLSDAVLVAPTKNLSAFAAPRPQQIVQDTPEMTLFPASLSSSSASRLAACPNQAGFETRDLKSSHLHDISFEISSGTASSFMSESEVNRVSQSSGTTVDCCVVELSNASSSAMSGSDSRSSRSSFAIETSEEEDSISPGWLCQMQDLSVPDQMGDEHSTSVVPDLDFLAGSPVSVSSSPTPTVPSDSDRGATARGSRRGQSQRISEAKKDLMHGRNNSIHLEKPKLNSAPSSSQHPEILQPTPLESTPLSPASTFPNSTTLST
ncbi:hypothetical protein HDU98_005810 [Podochytrium sp. JEL0797]|nr:hypothetical protein HDU98_005810 [Podochytrium sp. JEL0797]